jgi:light-regulated signal transduction histidine kinase (bacteriophytochrome)
VGTREQKLEPTGCEAVLAWTKMNLHLSIQESGAIVTNDPLPTVRADQAQLVQVFQNLLANAIQYRGDEPPRIHISAQDCGAEWLLGVKDNGIGIDPRYAQYVFGVFKRLHGKERPGTGIGLAICQRIVERHGGRIWVESEPGQGATFFFTLPKAAAREAAGGQSTD